MLKRSLTAIVSIAVLAMIVGTPGLAGAAKSRDLSGTLTISGSTALLPLANAAAQEFQAANPKVTVQVSGGGSGTGLGQVEGGAVDIGDSDVYANAKTQGDLVDHQVAVVCFVMVVNKSVNITNVTQQQLYNIYAAPYTSKARVDNWSQIGGPNQKVITVLRPTSSGTRKTFDKIVLKGGYEFGTQALQQDSTNLVLQTVAQTRGALGYAALGNAQTFNARGNYTILSYNGVAPTKANIVTDKYKIISYEHMYTKGPASPLAQAFIDFVTSTAVQKNLAEAKLGFISINDMKAKIPQ